MWTGRRNSKFAVHSGRVTRDAGESCNQQISGAPLLRSNKLSGGGREGKSRQSCGPSSLEQARAASCSEVSAAICRSAASDEAVRGLKFVLHISLLFVKFQCSCCLSQA